MAGLLDGGGRASKQFKKNHVGSYRFSGHLWVPISEKNVCRCPEKKQNMGTPNHCFFPSITSSYGIFWMILRSHLRKPPCCFRSGILLTIDTESKTAC